MMKLDKELMDVNFFELEEIRRKFDILGIDNADFNVVNYVKYLIKNTSIEAYGSVGGEITRRLVQMGEQHMSGMNYQSK